MTNILKLPISNVYGKGDYCVTMHLGSEKSSVNLLIDTGSSTLVVKAENYQPEFDKNLTASSIVQGVNYGIGGWNGPVIYSSLNVHEHCPHSEHPHRIAAEPSLNLTNASVALVLSTKQQQTFGDADGILGLAYHHLNKGFNLSDYFTKQKIAPELSYPWPFAPEMSEDLKTFKKLLWQYPEHDISPYFTELEAHQLVANKFAFYSKRSAIHINKSNTDKTAATTLAQDPLNHGFLILGGGEEQTDLYQGEFKQIKISHDIYYNAELISVQVGDNPAISAPPLQAKHLKSYCTNAIIDTGAGGVVLTAALYQQVISELINHNASFAALLEPFKELSAQEIGIDANLVELSQWPEITFNFVSKDNATSSNNDNVDTYNTEGHNAKGLNAEGLNVDSHDNEQETVALVCSPETYWQVNTPNYGKACFRFLSQLPQWPNQSIIGLPLLNNYYVVFDRSVDKTGVIKFAQQQ